jgi:SAM-dependent methyltransferase
MAKIGLFVSMAYWLNLKTWLNIFKGNKFNEEIYLFHNPDIACELKNQKLVSGKEHFIRFGFKENRKFCVEEPHFVKDYKKLVKNLIDTNPNNLELAMSIAVGSPTIKHYKDVGSNQYNILKHIGLKDGMTIYDLGCGSGRTAQALSKNNWHGAYIGVDIIPELVEYLKLSNPNYSAYNHNVLSIKASTCSLDILFAFSLFTHLTFEETFVYFKDIHRSLKKNGKFLFSFITINKNENLFLERIKFLKAGSPYLHQDTFMNKEIIENLVKLAGFESKVDYYEPYTKYNGLEHTVAILRKI